MSLPPAHRVTYTSAKSGSSESRTRADGNPPQIPVILKTLYIESWIKALKDDKREVFRAAADAQKAADWCLGHHPDYRLAIGAPEMAEGVKTSPTTKPTTTMPVAAAQLYRPEGLKPVSESMPEHLKRRLYGPTPEAPMPDNDHERTRAMRM